MKAIYMIVSALAAALALFICAAPARAAADAYSENRLLQAELALAMKPDIYFIVDLDANKVYFKARGIALKEIAILGKRFWGRTPEIEARELIGKSVPIVRKREEISSDDEPVPGATTQPPVLKNAAPAPNASAFEVNALELRDMPASYSIKFEKGISLVVRPEPVGAGQKALSLARKAGWYAYMPVLTLWKTVKKEPVRVVQITLNAKDAQALYWALHDGNSVIFYAPQK